MRTHKNNRQPTKRYMRSLLLQQRRERLGAELAEWQTWRAARPRPANVDDWTIEHARECA
jgi:hypothetical protein